MRLVAYIRVSTGEQERRGTIEQQRDAVRIWAKSNGHRIVGWCADDGVSGSLPVEDRPGLTDALAKLDTADGIAVRELGRLARDLTTQEGVLAQVWSHGKRAFTLDGEVARDDPDDPMRTAMRQTLGVFNQLERGMIRARMRAGRRAKRGRGGYIGGAPAFGVRAEGRELRPDAAEAATVARILELRESGLSYREVASALQAEGRRPKRGKTWHVETLRRVVGRAEAPMIDRPTSD